MKKLPLVDIRVDDKEVEQLKSVLRSGWMTMGPKTEMFEKMFADFIGAEYAVAVSSGTAALQVSMSLFDLSSQDEVITTPFTWESPVSAILYAGGKPVFADIEKNSGNISVRTILDKASKKTKGIVVVHYAGWPVEMDKITEIAREENWFVVEDSAHALGTKYKGVKAGILGDLGCFSFGSTKTITTGEGGMVTTNNPDFYKHLKVLRNYGETRESRSKHVPVEKKYDITELSYNFKINELASAVGIAQLSKINKVITAKKRAASLYYSYLEDVKGLSLLYPHYSENITPLFIPVIVDKGLENKRVDLMKRMREKGIETTIQYPVVYALSIYKDLIEGTHKCPVAEEISRRVFSLPSNRLVNKSHLESIVSVVKDWLK